MISIVVPTITGREHWLERCLRSYKRSISPFFAEIIVIKDKPSCGIAWNEGIAQATGTHIHLTADDIEAHEGWWVHALESTRLGELPAARILNTDSTLQSCGTDHTEAEEGTEAFVARIPFGSRQQFDAIGPMMNEQYMGDYWFSHRGRQCGYPSVVRRGYLFTHHYAQEGRIDTLDADVRAYKRRGGK